MRRSRAAIGVIALATLSLAACSGQVRDSAPSGSASIPDLPGDAVPRPEPRSRYGNGPVYEVFDKTYRVMDSGSGYKERGVASWYGKKFHGRLTSNREPYDMYAMTAAHKTLPLPTYVRVRNLRNNRSIIVRVNDRGPFVHNRIIDLSYAAALKLDMVRDGTSLVEVTAISFDDPPGDRPVRVVEPAQPPAPKPAPAPEPETTPEIQKYSEIFVQVGAFGDRANAERRRSALLSGGIGGTFIFADEAATPPMYRVRIGPIDGVNDYDALVRKLEALGISNPYLVAL
ncbi:MAG: septal ring lytic transglycosylase RlpA family protein [Gammaproteobacteria bacterium]|nr:septal ring lytic transglycosylase RlpA family protein [Gammaproteobacteria bacterium]MDH3757256.1 septal ring lytic transglycosylase RlpA family protein [Gammaproteobacteria bacterium]MDH3846718.1 septal ring lytic transglycosylase RlpA family protein [Gammaproteobacteria bacterium]MDH3863374.1 septal ring lytic transglycosylase RlpA family protein [Gammaproteobacteria bacterium]MDH3904838.1 septal ring lytic transglycosylase RlpA family protein [Gammaproteobacteria bacterium]